MLAKASEPRTEKLLLSAQRALLGAIGAGVLAICIRSTKANVEMIVYAEKLLPEEEREALDAATAEIAADFPGPVPVYLRIVDNAEQPFERVGIWVFLRLGCTVA